MTDPTIRKLLKSERGNGLVEFALAANVLFAIVFGVIDCSRALYAYHFTAYAAREATRYAMVRGSTWGTSCSAVSSLGCSLNSSNANIVKSYVQGIVPLGIDSGTSLTVTTTWPGTALAGSATTCNKANGNNSVGCLVQVQVSYSYSYFTALLPTSALVMKSTSEVVILQ
jgi:Flp pilus assembly protein TadG